MHVCTNLYDECAEGCDNVTKRTGEMALRILRKCLKNYIYKYIIYKCKYVNM